MKIKIFLIIIYLFNFNVNAKNLLGIVKAVDGNIMVKHQNDTNWYDLKQNQVIFDNDTIKTLEKSSGIIELPDKTKVIVSENTKVEPESLIPEKIRLNLKSGGIKSFVTKKINLENTFRIQTSVATVGVRGTIFEVLSSPVKGNAVLVNEGNVAVKSGLSEMIVKQNQKLDIIEKGKLGKIKNVIPGESLLSITDNIKNMFVSEKKEKIDSAVPDTKGNNETDKPVFKINTLVEPNIINIPEPEVLFYNNVKTTNESVLKLSGKIMLNNIKIKNIKGYVNDLIKNIELEIIIENNRFRFNSKPDTTGIFRFKNISLPIQPNLYKLFINDYNIFFYGNYEFQYLPVLKYGVNKFDVALKQKPFDLKLILKFYNIKNQMFDKKEYKLVIPEKITNIKKSVLRKK